ncbi:protein argonaute 16-like isoform X2 [Phalaenopsis equestris]|uniref:protein argonaute 16-like isoform X2 n=1 Tax=Phalaenopsis equestris TaxID=78828 RepID=UPI0009E5585D|nr:protein argonaute 16-like isoform X2 [Phalaenopsis equestris]
MVSPDKTPNERSQFPPCPSSIPPNAIPDVVESDHEKRIVMARPSFGSEGRHIQLLTNYFTVNFNIQDQFFYQYNVSIKSIDNLAVEGKSIGRKVMDRLCQTCSSELGGKEFVYDGDNLFTVGPLPCNNYDFIVVLEESSRVPCGCPGGESPSSDTRKKLSKHSLIVKELSVQIRYATKVPLSEFSPFHGETETDHIQDALRVLDMILRQQQARRGCLLVRQSYFDGDPANVTDLGGGITFCRGFHSSFRTTHGGLFLNMDVSNTIILKPGPVIDFLIANQNIRNAKEVNWAKAKRTLKNMRIKTIHTNLEFKIIGLTPLPCSQQTFVLRGKIDDGKDLPVEVNVFNYFKEKRIELTWSSSLPCLVVGKPKRPIYLPIELCNLISLQRYTRAISSQLRAALVEKSRQKPQEQIKAVTNAFQKNQYNDEPLISSCGITIEKQLAQIDGRILNAPTLKIGNEEDCFPKNGRWNFTNKKLLKAKQIESWAIVNFSARCDLSHLSREMINCARKKGIIINRPFTIIEENHQFVRMEPAVRVEKMFEEVIKRFPCPPQLLLCVLPEKKNSAIYGPWKKKNLHEMGVVTQCVSPARITENYLNNVILKINTKLGGINSLLAVEANPSIPLVTDVPTMIVGMVVSHGSLGLADLPSVAAAVGSRNWPLISRYSASVRTQSAKIGMINSLYKPLSNGEDDGMMRWSRKVHWSILLQMKRIKALTENLNVHWTHVRRDGTFYFNFMIQAVAGSRLR